MGSTLGFWIRTYGHYSEEYLKYLYYILRGWSPKEIINRRHGKVKSIHELRVPLRYSYEPEDEDEDEDEDNNTARWSPPYADGKDWREYEDMELDKDEIKYWPYEEMEPEDIEFEGMELEDNKFESGTLEDRKEEKTEVDDVKVQKSGMNITKNHSPAMCSSISRFCTVADSRGIDCIGQHGVDSQYYYRPFASASGRIKGSKANTCSLWRPHGLSG